MTELTEQVRLYVEAAFESVPATDFASLLDRQAKVNPHRSRRFVAITTAAAIAAAVASWLALVDPGENAQVSVAPTDNRHYELIDDWTHTFDDQITSRVVVSDDTVLVSTLAPPGPGRSSTVHALDRASGQVRWERQLDGQGAVQDVGRDIALAWVDTGLVALNVTDGVIRWKLDRSGLSSPLVHGSSVYVIALGAESGEVLAIDLAEGMIRWRRAMDVGQQTTLRVYDGTLYAATEAASSPRGSTTSLIALDTISGRLRWPDVGENGVRLDGLVPSDTPDAPSLVVARKTIAIRTGQLGPDGNDTLSVVDRTTGALRWQATPGGWTSNPVVIGDTLIVATSSGVLEGREIAASADRRGRVIWRIAVGPSAVSSVVQVRNRVVATGSAVVVADARTGVVRGRARVPQPIVIGRSGSLVAVVAPLGRGPLAIIDARAGDVVARRTGDGTPLAAFVDRTVVRTYTAASALATILTSSTLRRTG